MHYYNKHPTPCLSFPAIKIDAATNRHAILIRGAIMMLTRIIFDHSREHSYTVNAAPHSRDVLHFPRIEFVLLSQRQEMTKRISWISSCSG